MDPPPFGFFPDPEFNQPRVRAAWNPVVGHRRSNNHDEQLMYDKPATSKNSDGFSR